MPEQNAPESPLPDQSLTGEVTAPEATEPVDTDALNAENTRLKDEVARLKDENAKRRIDSQATEDLRHRLHVELVRATGRLADPSDLPYTADHLTDSDALNSAVDQLLESKPHLRARTPKGDVGQGNRGQSEQPTTWLDILKNFA